MTFASSSNFISMSLSLLTRPLPLALLSSSPNISLLFLAFASSPSFIHQYHYHNANIYTTHSLYSFVPSFSPLRSFSSSSFSPKKLKPNNSQSPSSPLSSSLSHLITKKKQNVNLTSPLPKDSSPPSSSPSTPNDFSSLGLSPSLVSGLLSSFSISQPTDIQRITIPLVLNGNSLFIASQTGVGKTFSYLLPLMEMLKRDEMKENYHIRPSRPRCLIILPNRELTNQTLFTAKSLSFFHKLRAESIIGGESQKKQMRDMEGNIDIIMGTPGRLKQYIDKGIIFLSDVKCVVLDESDTLFTKKNGFIGPLVNLLYPLKMRQNNVEFNKNGEKDIQYLLVSASFPAYLKNNLNHLFPPIQFISTASLHQIPQSLEQRFVEVGQQDKMEILGEILKREQKKYEKENQKDILPNKKERGIRTIKHQSNYEIEKEQREEEEEDEDDKEDDHHSTKDPTDPTAPLPPTVGVHSHLLGHRVSISPTSLRSSDSLGDRLLPVLPPTLIFCNTIASCRALDYYLNENGWAGQVSSYHGEIPPQRRLKEFQSFVLGQKPLLVCTDIASRGLDTRGVHHVIQFDVASNPIDFLHRIGRTARMGRRGIATALITAKDKKLTESIKFAIKKKGNSLNELIGGWMDKEEEKQLKESGGDIMDNIEEIEEKVKMDMRRKAKGKGKDGDNKEEESHLTVHPDAELPESGIAFTPTPYAPSSVPLPSSSLTHPSGIPLPRELRHRPPLHDVLSINRHHLSQLSRIGPSVMSAPNSKISKKILSESTNSLSLNVNVKSLGKDDPKWKRYKTNGQILKEKIEGTLTKQMRIFTERIKSNNINITTGKTIIPKERVKFKPKRVTKGMTKKSVSGGGKTRQKYGTRGGGGSKG